MRFLGIIPSDQIHKILYEEHKEDMLKSVGIITYSTAIDDSLDSSVVQAFIRRVPWIMLGTLGGLLLAGIIGVFENTLKDNLVLAAFIPLVVYVSAAVGAQTQILFIRDLALNGKMSILSYALKQMFTTFLIAVTSGIFITVIVAVFWQTYYLGLIIGLAATASIIFSVLIAMLVPYLLNTYKQDPANGSGPFATIIQDAASVVIYFAIASFLL
jgi:magnesium transporter